MGSVGTMRETTPAETFEEPVFDTKHYKSTTQEMKDLVASVYKEMQAEFPILASSVTFEFWNGGNHEAWGDSIWVNGRDVKRAIEWKNKEAARAVIAHELTHVIQNRLGAVERAERKANGTFERGTDYAEELSTRILDNAIARYQQENSGVTKDQLYKDLKKAYGFDWDRAGFGNGRNPGKERMAVAYEKFYKGYGHLASLGKYVADEMKKAMQGKIYRK